MFKDSAGDGLTEGGNRLVGYFLPREWQLQWYFAQQPRFERQLLEFVIHIGDERIQLELQFE